MVEAALAFPFFLCFITILIFFLFQLDVQRRVKIELMETVRKASYINGDESGIVLTAINVSSVFRKEKVRPVLILPQNEEDHIGIKACYEYKPPYDIFHKSLFIFKQGVKIRKWRGEESKTEQEKEDLVYVTKYGTVFHESCDCTYLKPKLQKVTMSEVSKLRNSSGEKYRACRYCKNQIEEFNQCYITPDGNRFHRSAHCWELERDVYQIPRSQVGNRKPCSKCIRRSSQSTLTFLY